MMLENPQPVYGLPEKDHNKNNSKKLYILVGLLLLIIILLLVALIFTIYNSKKNNEDTSSKSSSKSTSISSESSTSTSSIMSSNSTSSTTTSTSQSSFSISGRKTTTKNITCTSAYLGEQTISYSVDILDTEEVSIEQCSLVVQGDNYKFKVGSNFESIGYMISSESQIPTAASVSTSNLNVVYSDSYPLKKVLRLSDMNIPNSYNYTSYYEVGADNCSQWQSIYPVLACGMPGIALQDNFFITPSCTTINNSVDEIKKCDELIDTLRVVKAS